MAAVLMAWFHHTSHRVAQLLDSRLQSLFRGLCCVIFDIYCLVFKRNLEVLDSFLESNVLLYLVDTVLAMEMYTEGYFLDICLLLRAC
jgi:hypothetical protein